jgi:hypothetical protein
MVGAERSVVRACSSATPIAHQGLQGLHGQAVQLRIGLCQRRQLLLQRADPHLRHALQQFRLQPIGQASPPRGVPRSSVMGFQLIAVFDALF